MLTYIVRRLLMMIPTLLAISAIVFVIIQLPPGDYLSTYIAELQAQGERRESEKIDFLREQYGLDRPTDRAIRSTGWSACCRAISAIPSSTTCRSTTWSATGCC